MSDCNAEAYRRQIEEARKTAAYTSSMKGLVKVK